MIVAIDKIEGEGYKVSLYMESSLELVHTDSYTEYSYKDGVLIARANGKFLKAKNTWFKEDKDKPPIYQKNLEPRQISRTSDLLKIGDFEYNPYSGEFITKGNNVLFTALGVQHSVKDIDGKYFSASTPDGGLYIFTHNKLIAHLPWGNVHTEIDQFHNERPYIGGGYLCINVKRSDRMYGIPAPQDINYRILDLTAGKEVLQIPSYIEVCGQMNDGLLPVARMTSTPEYMQPVEYRIGYYDFRCEKPVLVMIPCQQSFVANNWSDKPRVTTIDENVCIVQYLDAERYYKYSIISIGGAALWEDVDITEVRGDIVVGRDKYTGKMLSFSIKEDIYSPLEDGCDTIFFL